ncbi:WD repeat-containing protein 60 [Mactra antiquata]
MPSQKQRSKEDTWTTDELSRALNKTGERRHHRDEDRKRDHINGEDKHRRTKDDERRRRHRDEDEDRGQRLTEEERDRQREERRRKREGKDGGKEKKGKEISFRGKSDNREIELNDVNDEQEDRHRRHRSDRERDRDDDRRHHDRQRRHHDEDEDRHRRHKDDDNDRDKRRRHKDDDDRRRRRHDDDNEEDERERRRQERRREKETIEDEERRRRHEEKKERRKEEERRKEKEEERRRDKDRDRDRDRDKERDRDRDRDKERDRDRDRHKDKSRKGRESEEDRREREREERRREREDKHKEDKKHSKKSKQEEVKREEPEEDEYNYEEDFEDYDDDFEEEDDDDNDEDTTAASGRNVHETIHKQDRGGTKLDYCDSEVNDVLRALDAENERLLNSSSRSPQVSTNYGRSQYRDESDKDSDDDYERTYQPRQNRPQTAINFVSAKQRAVNKKTASKTMQRGKDLLAMLDLDYASFDIMDLPPVNEYDLYIRAFGSSDTRQAYVQTNEDNTDRDIQTEEIDVRQKWTQHPPEDFKGYGRGDGDKDIDDEEESQNKVDREQDLGRLNKFLEKAGQVIAILLEEGKEDESKSTGQSKTDISTSEGYTQLDILPILQGRHVIFSHFSPVQPNLLLTVYSSAQEITDDNCVSKRGVICVWNTNEPSSPQKILVCTSEPRCCCFSPVKPSLVFAGMSDGSIAMWDLREPSSLHSPTVVNNETYSLRYPTYDTACVIKEENHHSPVSSIIPIYTYTNFSKTDDQQVQASEDTSSGLSFQLVSTEESAVLHFWVVAEIGIKDIAGSENDLGLAPGAGVKLLKSSSLTLNNPSKDMMQSSTLRANDMTLIPNDPNHFYVATDSGSIIHGIRFGKRTFPRAHAPVIDTVVNVVSIDFSPFDQPCFLAGCSDGTFSIYHTKAENPLISWPYITKGRGIQCVRWSRCRPCVFYILDTSSTLYVFDLLEGDMHPKTVETISKERITSFSLTTVHQPDGYSTSNKEAQMLFSYESGKIEIHTITKDQRTAENLEQEYLGSYLQRF